MKCPRIKCVVVGDNAVGKTCLMIAFTKNAFPTDYIPRIFEGYADYHTVDDTQVVLELWDVIAGDVEVERLRPLAYDRTDVFILCFSVMDPTGYERVRTKWAPELAHFKPDAPVLLVGLKLDLREELLDYRHCTAPIMHVQGLAMSEDIGAKLYLECSALKGLGVKTVFENAMRLALQFPQARGRKSRDPNRKECIIV